MKLGSAKRKTTSKLRTAAPNNEWFKNVVKSTGYATADIVKETIPSTFEFVESNGKDAIQLYNDLRQDGPKSITKLLAQSMDKNAYMKMAKDALANTKEDIKSGKFYNKEREESSVVSDIGDGEDFDFSFNEDEFSFDDDDFNDFGDSELSDGKKVTNVKKVTVNNINANITKNNPMVQSINKQSEVIIASAESTNRVNTALATTNFTLTSKIASDMMTGMSTINDNLSALVNFNNDSMSKYVAASLQYYSDSLSVLNNTLEHLKNPVAQPAQEAKEQIDPFLGNGALNFKEYGKLLKKNMGNVIQDDLMLNSIYSFASDTDTIKMLAASPLKIIPKMISKVIVPTIVRESAAEFDKSFSNFFPALLNKFNKLADNDNWFLSKIGKLFGFKPSNKTTVDVSMYNKGDMNFNGITQKAITEVIPTYLRKILAAINGKNEMIFDYQSGKFTDYMSAVRENEKTVKNRSLGAMEVYSDLRTRLDAIRFTDEKDKETLFKDFEDFMFKLSKSNGINPHVRTVKGETVDELKDLYSGQFTEIFRSALLSLNKSDIMKLMGSDIFSAKESVTRYYKDAQENIGSSILPVLEAWDSKDDYEKGKDGSYKPKDSLKAISLDKYGKSSLDYLREMRNLLVEGIVVFPTRNIGNSGYRSNKNNAKDSEVYKSRKSRLDEIKEESNRVSIREQESKVHSIKTYSEEERNRLKAKGIMVADSIGDLTMEGSTAQLTDMFRTYSQLRENDSTSANQLGNAGGWVKKMFSHGSKKVNSMRDVFDNIFSMPGRVLSNVFNELDNGLYKLVFGVNHDGSDQSFLSKVVTSIKSEFSEFFNWTKDTFFTPLHEALLGEKGILTKIKNSEAMASLKKFGSKMADWAFGDLDENGHRRDGAFSDAFNDIKDMTNSVRRTITGKGYTDRFGNEYGRETNSVFGNVNGFMGDIYKNAKLYLVGNKKDKYVDSPMLVPTAFNNPIVQQPQLDPIQSLYTPDSAARIAESKQRPIVALDKPNKPQIDPSISSPLLTSYLENNNLTGNGGSNIFDWLKNNISLQYSVDVNGQKGEAKTIKFGEDVDDTVGSGGVAPAMVNGFPYFSQRDPRYANTPYNLSTGKGGGQSLAFGDRGCGPTAMSMVANGLGTNVDPIDMANMATENGFSVAGGTKGSFFKSIGEKLGLNAKEKQTTESQVESALMQGKPIIFRGRKTSDKVTPFTPDGHFVVGVGGKNGKIQINDPNGVESSGVYDVKDIVGESNKMWTFDDTGKGSDFNPTGPKYDVISYKKKEAKFVTDWSRKISPDGSGEINGAVTELAEGFREASADMLSLIFGEEASADDREKRVKEFGVKFREALPKGIAGGLLGGGLGTIVGATGGMGLMGSFFLPGGPIGGALLGTAIGFASQSDRFKDWLFGKKDPEDSSKRIGGFIDQKTQKFFKDHKTTIVGGAALGGLKGMLGGAGFLGQMFFGGPITGALMGAGLGLALRSERFQNMIFGEDDPESGKKIGGLLSKSYNAIVDKKKVIGGAAIGVLGGAASGAVLSSMGILGSTFFLGPVGGALVGAGLGIAAASEKWRDKVFGVYDEEDKKRKGGLLQEVKANIVNEVLEPIKLGARETADSFKFWFEEKIIYPVADFFGPMKTAMTMMFQDTIWAIQDIGNGIKARFQKYIGEPMGKFLQEKVFDPFKQLFGGMWKATTWLSQKVLQAPFSVLGLANKGAAGFVESRAKKRKAKSDTAASQMSVYEEMMANGQTLSLEDQIKYENLKKRRDRYFIAEDDDRLNAKTNYEEKKKKRLEDITQRKKEASEDLKRRKAELQNKNEFRRIFGAKYEYNEQALQQYKSLFTLEDGKKIKGRRAKKALGNKAEEFIRSFNATGKAKTDEEVKDIKDEIKENLSPMRKALMSIENNIATVGLSIQNNLNKLVNKFLTGASDTDTVLGKSVQNVGNAKRAVVRTAKGAKRRVVKTVKSGINHAKQTASAVVDGVQYGASVLVDGAERMVDGAVDSAKYVGGVIVDGADNVTNKSLYKSEDRLAAARREKERLKAERATLKSGTSEGSGGRKDASWLMVGKGKDKEKEPKEKKDKKGGLLSTFSNSMFSALKRFDKVNDKEEAEKAEQKEAKAKLAEKQKAVSGKNYVALQKELSARNKEAEEKAWKERLLDAVTNIKSTASEHKIGWSEIFSKKGLITGALLAALPFLSKFLANPVQAIGDAIGSILNGIKISIGWLFGNNNKGREDAFGNKIDNTGLEGATARLARNATKEAITSGVAQKGAKVISKIASKTKGLVKGAKNLFTLSDSAYEIYQAGVRNADDLVSYGVRNADDLIELGVKNADDLAALGVRNIDDLAKLGIKSSDDLAKLGVDLTSKKGKSQLKKFGLKATKEFMDSPVAALSDAVPKSMTSKIAEGVSKLTNKASVVADKVAKVAGESTGTAIGKTMNAAQPAVTKVIETANKTMNSKFVTMITDWLNAVFTNQKVVSKLGADTAKNTLSELTQRISKTLTDKVLARFAPQISEALAKVAGRAAGAVTTGGILTLGFGVADVISGAVNAERLFEIPPGTATAGMKTMSSVLQFILGLGMIGPIIDVANEIVAEVTGMSFLTAIATVGYSFLTQATGGDVKLKNLQGQFDEDYQKYKEANGLKDLTKRAYQDLVNPSFGSKVAKPFVDAWDKTKEFGSKVWNKTKEVGSSVVEFRDKAREKVSEFGSKVWNKTKEVGSQAWDATKQFGAKAWDKTKEIGSQAWDITKKAGNFAGKTLVAGANKLTGDVFNDAKIREELGLNEDVKIGLKDRTSMGLANLIETITFGKVDSKDTIHGILGIQNAITSKANELWTGLKDSASKKVDEAKKIWKDGWTSVGKKITGSLGLVDENGEPLTFTEGVSVVKDKTTEFVQKHVKEFQDSTSKWWADTKADAKTKIDDAKKFWNDGWTSVGKKITGSMGLVDDNGEPLPFTEGVSVLKDKAVETVKKNVKDFQDGSAKWWADTKADASKWWNGKKKAWSDSLTGVGKYITGTLGLVDDNGEPLPFTEGVSVVKNKSVTAIKSFVKGISDGASDFWSSAKSDLEKNWKSLKDGFADAFDGINKFFGGLFNFTDSNGNPIGLTDGVKNLWNDTKTSVSNFWTNAKESASNFWSSMTNLGKEDVQNRNNQAATSAKGGFGGEEIPMNIGARGCGPTAMAMVTSKLTGQQVDPVSMSNLATQGGFANQYGTNGKYFTYAADKYGINASEGRTTEENLTRALSSGQPVILRGQSDGKAGSAFTRAGHYVVAVGQKDGKVIINDPRGVQYSGAYDMNEVVSQSNVMWSFGQKRGPYGTKLQPLVLGGASSDEIPGELIYKYAAVHVGKPYVWGANGPSSFDCSGLVNYAAKQAGIKLPSSRPTAATWKNYCKAITRDELRVGDLGFYRQNGSITHVAIYAGDGQWCHAEGGSGPKGQGGKVKVNSPSYLNEFGRIPGVSGTATQYIGNVTGLTGNSSTVANASNGILSDISGFISTLGKSAINAAITGETPSFMSFSDYLSSNGTSTSSDSGSTYTGESVSLGSRKTDAATLNRYLGGRLANKGDTIVRLSNKYGADPAFVASILHHESANGTSNAIVNYNNPGGIMDANNNWKTLKRFPSLDSGIEYTISNLKKNYFDQGLKTIPAIGSKYAPVGAANDPSNLNKNWVPNVTKLYNQYSYDSYNPGDTQYSGSGDNYGGFGDVDTISTEVNKNTIGGSLFTDNTVPVSKSYSFTDRTSRIGMGDNYVRNMVQDQLKDTTGTSNVSSILEKVLDILSRIADNTGITSKNIKDAITTVMTTNTAVTNVNTVNGGTSTTKKTVNTNAQYTESEMRNRNIAQQIAQGRFV